MASPYDILINLQAKAQEVQAAAAEVSNLVQQVQQVGPTLAANIQQGDAVVQTLARDIKDVSTSATEAGNATAAGMDKGTKAAAGTAKAVKDIGGAADDAGHHVGSLRETFEQAFAFGIGSQIVEKVLEVPTRLIEGFTEAIHQGVEFNKEMETLGIGVAASMRQASPEKFLDFHAAQVAGEVALDQIRAKANLLGLDMHSLAETFQINLRVMTEAGITEVQQQIETVLGLTQAAASKGLSGFQAQRDIIDLLNGKGDRTIFSKELGITDEDIKTATTAGNLYEFLKEKLSAYSEAGAAASATFAAASQRLSNNVQQLEGVVTKPLFDVLKKSADDLAATIAAPAFQQSFGSLSEEIANDAKAVVNFAASMVPLIPTLVETGKDVAALTVALGVGALITALGNAVTAAGSLDAALLPIAGRITAMLTAMGPAGAIIGAATAALLLLDAALNDYVARARALLNLVGQFDKVSTSLRDQIGQADTPDKKTAARVAAEQQLTSLLQTQARMKEQGYNADEKQLEAVGDEILQTRAILAELDNNAGKKAGQTRLEGDAGKYSGLAKSTQEEEDRQYEAGLDHVQQLAKLQGEADAKRAEAAKAFGLDETASYQQIQSAAQRLRQTQQEAADHRPTLIDTSSLEIEVEKYKQQLAPILASINAAKAKAIPGSGVQPTDVDPYFESKQQIAADLTGKLNEADRALTDARTQNTAATRENATALTGSNAEGTKALQIYSDLQKLQVKLTDTNKAATAQRLQSRQEEVQGELAAAQLAAGPKGTDDKVQALQTESRELRYQLEYLRTHNQLDQQGIEWAKQRAAAEVQNNVAKKEGVAAGKQAAADAKAQHQEEAAADRDRKTALLEIRDQLQEIQKNPFLTEDQRQQGMKPLLEAELALIKQNIAARQLLIDKYGTDPKHAEEAARLRQENVQDQHQGTEARQQLQGMTLIGQMRTQMVQLQNQWGTVQQSIARGVTSIASEITEGLGNAITGLITGTKTWGQAFVQVGESIISTIIKIVVQQTVGRALLFAINKAFGSQEQSTAESQGESLQASYAPAAISASIASEGEAAGVGLAAYAAAIAAGTFAGGFAEGGRVPGRSSRKDNILLPMATGEFVTRSLAVDYYGAPLLHMINDMRIPREHLLASLSGMTVARSGLAGGGMVGGGSSNTPILLSSNPTFNHKAGSLTLIQPRSRSEIFEAMQSTEGQAIHVATSIRHKMKIGIPS